MSSTKTESQVQRGLPPCDHDDCGITKCNHPTIWHDCYSASWKGLITDASFAHPAKFSRALIERIYDHMLAECWIAPGDLIGDPFGGIGTAGIVAAYRRLRWIGVELEERFKNMALYNFALHESKIRGLGNLQPTILRGDSRRFHEVIGQVPGIVTSPPYEAIAAGAGGLNTKPPKHPGQQSGRSANSASQNADQHYGTAPGQIGALKSGQLDAVVTSPPYAETHVADSEAANLAADGNARSIKDSNHGIRYGTTPGQIGALKSGQLDAVVTSPPFSAPNAQPRIGQGTGSNQRCGYKGDRSESNIELLGNQTYWQAMAEVYSSCRLALKPGGYMAVVIKSYVKAGKIVDLPADTLKLLLSLGYEHVQTFHAMLTQEISHADLFNGVDVKVKQRKSFFRRLAESKGSPRIDHETVLFVRKPND